MENGNLTMQNIKEADDASKIESSKNFEGIPWQLDERHFGVKVIL